MRKDLRLMLQEGREHGLDLPVVEKTLECLDQGAAAGLGDRAGVAQSVFWRARGRG